MKEDGQGLKSQDIAVTEGNRLVIVQRPAQDAPSAQRSQSQVHMPRQRSQRFSRRLQGQRIGRLLAFAATPGPQARGETVPPEATEAIALPTEPTVVVATPHWWSSFHSWPIATSPRGEAALRHGHPRGQLIAKDLGVQDHGFAGTSSTRQNERRNHSNLTKRTAPTAKETKPTLTPHGTGGNALTRQSFSFLRQAVDIDNHVN